MITCRPGCAMTCPTTPWTWVLDDRPVYSPFHPDAPPTLFPPYQRLAWALHGLGPTKPPVPPDGYADLLAAFVAAYGVRQAVEGLRTAARTPAAHGSGVDTARFAAMADRLRESASVASHDSRPSPSVEEVAA